MGHVAQETIPVAIVTGASGDIGRAVVERLLRENWAVMMVSRNREGTLMEVRSELREQYPMTILHACEADVLVEHDVHHVIAQVQRYMGSPHLLVNAHGHDPIVQPSESLPADDFADILMTDVAGTFRTCQAIGRLMLANGGGSIVNISSIHSVATYPCRSAYTAAKSAIVGLSKVLAIEWASRGVRVNVVSPWQVRGSRTETLNGKQMRAVLQRNPTGCLIEPGEVANAVLYLHHTPSMNGHNLVLDGGVTASAWYLPHT